jgi:hypothetical protein
MQKVISKAKLVSLLSAMLCFAFFDGDIPIGYALRKLIRNGIG